MPFLSGSQPGCLGTLGCCEIVLEVGVNRVLRIYEFTNVEGLCHLHGCYCKRYSEYSKNDNF